MLLVVVLCYSTAVDVTSITTTTTPTTTTTAATTTPAVLRYHYLTMTWHMFG